MTGAVIGIDLGGTKLSCALFSAEGAIIERSNSPLAARTGTEVGALIATEVRSLLSSARGRVHGVGVAIPGIYRAATGTVWAPNIPGWDDYPLVAELRAALPPEVAVRADSDRACAILGEAWRGKARGCRNAIFLAVGTGIGAGILAEGVVVRGAGDAAGAIGWLALTRPYREEYRAVGCFEHHASGAGLAAVARSLLKEFPEHRGPLCDVPAASLTAQHVFAAADAGDALALRVLDDAVKYWGMAIANLVSLFNPERIILGGGVFGPAYRFLDRIRAEAARWAQPISINQVTIDVSGLAGDAVLYGAGALALDAPAPVENGVPA